MFGSKSDASEDRRLYEQAAKVQSLSLEHEIMAIAKTLAVSDHFRRPVAELILALVSAEAYLFDLPPLQTNLSLTEGAAYRNFLRRRIKAGQDKRLPAILREAVSALLLLDALPETSAPSPFVVPLVNALPSPKRFIANLYSIIYDDALRSCGLFDGIRDAFTANVSALSDSKKLNLPADSELSPREMQRAYLRGTAFFDFLNFPVPLKLTHNERFHHMHVLGGTGAGKTTLLENLILHDLKSENRPSIVVIDSQGDLIRKLSRLAVMKDVPFVLITPKDTANPPALNIFDVNRKRLGSYDEATKEQVIAGVIQTFDYVFSGLIGADLTAKQSVLFRYIARLMLSLPDTLGRNATILDMLRLMEDPTPYQTAIDQLPPIQREFFTRDFSSKNFAQTKEQIRYRLHAIIENPTLARLFTSRTTKLDLFEELNRGSVILVDTAKDFLKGSSAHFGQIFISLVLQAVLERAALPESQRKHSFLFVDEAAEYFDANIDDLLTEARKQKLGCVFAHQYLDQCTSALRASLAANTGIKFAGGVSNADARAMATDMRTTAEYILAQPRLHFAAYIRNTTKEAISIPVQVGLLDQEPKLSDAEYAELIERSRSRVGYAATPQAPLSPPPTGEMSDEY